MTEQEQAGKQEQYPVTQKEIEITVFRELIDKLLDLPCLSTPANRQNVVLQLSKSIQHEILYAQLASGRQEVDRLVSTCFKYQGGWLSLLDTLKHFDVESIPWHKLQTFLSQHDLAVADTLIVKNQGVMVNLDNFSSSSSIFQPHSSNRRVNINEGSYNEFEQATLTGNGGNNLLGSTARDVTNNDYRQGGTYIENHGPVTINYNSCEPAVQKEPNPIGAAVTPPTTLWNIPYTPNPNFTGREKELTTLHRFLEGATSNLAVAALHGLGGMGKTRLAVEYSYRYREHYPYIWWLRSEETATLAVDYAELALKLGLAGNNGSILPDQPTLINLAKEWLTKNQGWLLIFDNVSSPQELYPYLPKTKHGTVIITSRFADWIGLTTQTLAIKPLTNQAAAQLLLSRTTQTDQQAAIALAEELGELPLALTQAGAYCAQTNRSLVSYLELFREEAKQIKLLARGQSEDYNQTVATTWQLAIKEVALSVPTALDLLRLCAFLAPDAIPLGLFVPHAANLPSPLAQLLKDELELDEVLMLLRRYSLIEVGSSFGQVNLHRLLQIVIRADLNKVERHEWLNAGLTILNWAFPLYSLNYRNWGQCALLLPHVERISQWDDAVECNPVGIARLCNQAGLYFKSRGLLNQARLSLEKTLAIARAYYGEDHPDFANGFNNLGTVLQDLGLFAQAKIQFEKALSLLKETDPTYPTALSNLANVLQDLGQFELAMEYYKRALELGKTIYGPYHSEFATTLNNIATLLETMGQNAKVLPYYEQVLEILPPDHHFYPGAINNVAYYLIIAGKPQQAKLYLEKLLRNLPADHPLFAKALDNLGVALLDLGETETAKKAFEDSLKMAEQLYGLHHPTTAQRFSNLAGRLLDMGEIEEAKKLYERALAISKEFYGPNDPVIADRLAGMGQIWSALNQYWQAKDMYEQSIAILEKAHGPDHPTVAVRLNDLGLLLKKARQLEDARLLYERARVINEKVYGLAHPTVAISYNNLGILLFEQGKLTAASWR